MLRKLTRSHWAFKKSISCYVSAVSSSQGLYWASYGGGENYCHQLQITWCCNHIKELEKASANIVDLFNLQHQKTVVSCFPCSHLQCKQPAIFIAGDNLGLGYVWEASLSMDCCLWWTFWCGWEAWVLPTSWVYPSLTIASCPSLYLCQNTCHEAGQGYHSWC